MSHDQGRKRSFFSRIGSWIPGLFSSTDSTSGVQESSTGTNHQGAKRPRTQPSLAVDSTRPIPTYQSRDYVPTPQQNNISLLQSSHAAPPAFSSTPWVPSTRREPANLPRGENNPIPVVNLRGEPIVPSTSTRVPLTTQDSSRRPCLLSWRRTPQAKGFGGDPNFASGTQESANVHLNSLRGDDACSTRSRLSSSVVSAIASRSQLERSRSTSLFHPMGLSERFITPDPWRTFTDAGSTSSRQTSFSQRSSNVTVKPGRYNQQNLTSTAMRILEELESFNTVNMFSVNTTASSSATSALKSRSYAPYSNAYERFRSRLRQNKLNNEQAQRSNNAISGPPPPSIPVNTTTPIPKAQIRPAFKPPETSIAPSQKRPCIATVTSSDGGGFTFSRPLDSTSVVQDVIANDRLGAFLLTVRDSSFSFRPPKCLSGEADQLPMVSTVEPSVSNSSGEVTVSEAAKSFKALVEAQKKQWTCDGCMLSNSPSVEVCPSCSARKPGGDAVAPITNPTEKNDALSKLIEMNRSKWTCEVCMLLNEPSASSCLACFGLRPSTKPTSSAAPPQPTVTVLSTAAEGDAFAKMLAANQSKWTCKECFVLNDPQRHTCAACSTVKPQESNKTSANDSQKSNSVATSKETQSITNSFSDFLSASKNKWTCDTCLVANEPAVTCCVACQTPKPGSTAPSAPSSSSVRFGTAPSTSATTESLPFGFGSSATKSSATSGAADTGFKFPVSTTSSSTAPTFIFGSSATKTTTSESAAPPIVFGASAVSSQQTSTTVAPSSTKSPFVFDASSTASPQQATPMNSSLSVVAPSSGAKPPIVFGASTTSTQQLVTPVSSSSLVTPSGGATSTFVFGASSSVASQQQATPVSSASVAPSDSGMRPFVFGASTATSQKPATAVVSSSPAVAPAASTFVFSASAPTTSVPTATSSSSSGSLFSFTTSSSSAPSLFPTNITGTPANPPRSFAENAPASTTASGGGFFSTMTTNPFIFGKAATVPAPSVVQPPGPQDIFASNKISNNNLFAAPVSQEPNNNFNKLFDSSATPAMSEVPMNGFDFNRSGAPATIPAASPFNFNATAALQPSSNFSFASTTPSAVMFSSQPSTVGEERSVLPKSRIIKKARRTLQN